MPARRPLEERFWEKVDKNGPIMPGMSTPCWVWTASRDGCGYGLIGLGDGTVGKANRVSYEMHHGPLGENECALHRCDNPPCVRPDHLFKGTQKVNADDREAKGRLVHYSGEDHWTKHKPECVARGDKQGFRVHPERAPMGERNRHAVLTGEQVRAMRKEHKETGVNYLVLAKKYGVTPATAGKAIRRETWKHLED
jgi:hypothetical protein